MSGLQPQPVSEPGTPERRVADLKDCFASLTRGLKRVSIYRHDVSRHAEFLEPAHAALSAVLEKHGDFEVGVTPNSFTYHDEPVHSEPATDAGVCFRLHRDGVRALVFRKGLPLVELASFVTIAMPDPSASGREDAVTELWKADLAWIGCKADRGWRDAPGSMDGPVVDAYEAALEAIGEAPPDQDTGRAELTAASADALDAALAPEPWEALAPRAARLAVSIVSGGFAGRDHESLADVVVLLLDEALKRHDPAAVAAVLDAVLQGACGAGVRPEAREVARRAGDLLAEKERLETLLAMLEGYPAHAQAYLCGVDQLPRSAGALLLGMLPERGDRQVRHRVAQAVAARAEGLDKAWGERLAAAPAPVARELLEVLPLAGFADPSAVALHALDHAAPDVREAGVRAVGFDARRALERLAPLLDHADERVRAAAATALADADPAAATALLLSRVEDAAFERRARVERQAFFRALGVLGTEEGWHFLCSRLQATRRRLLAREADEESRVLAVVGLAAMRTTRTLQLLEAESQPEHHQPPTVVAACRAAARSIRDELKRKGGA